MADEEEKKEEESPKEPHHIGGLLMELADIANCVSGDFHCLHFNVVGEDFDNIHANVLKKYYEEAADDFDEFTEKARMFGEIAKSPNTAAERISFGSFEPKGTVSRSEAVSRVDALLKELLEYYVTVFRTCNEDVKCPLTIGCANFLQTRIEYWSKEKEYFNKSRKNAGDKE